LSTSSSSVQFNATSYVVSESAGSFVVNVTRTGNTANAVTINYATNNGTAEKPSDYTNSSGTLQFAAGETQKSFVVPITDDLLVERTETFNVVLSAPGVGAFEGSPFTSTISILDDDKPLIALDETTSRAVALDSVLLKRDPFPLANIHNFSLDQRTRIAVFVQGVELNSTETPSSVLVQLEDNQNHIYPLVVEDVRKVPNFDWLSQIVVKLPDSIDSEGDFRITITFRGATGNKPLIRITKSTN
jgi:hypothetical protein